jgi:hypothetical protein
MRTRRRATIEELRLAVECLPRPTRVAMLEGIRANPIIVGAYTSRDGICPMLAAHRAGGRTSCLAFARAWDRFTLAGRRARPRRASERELLILATHLEASLLAEEGPAPGLAGAIAEHRDLVARRPPPPAKPRPTASPVRPGDPDHPGDPDRTSELRHRRGWAWTRVFRRYDDYERALARLDREALEAREARACAELVPDEFAADELTHV